MARPKDHAGRASSEREKPTKGLFVSAGMEDTEQTVTILVGGRRYRAAWRVEDAHVVVESDLGGEREPLNGAAAEVLAARLLKEIVLKNVR